MGTSCACAYATIFFGWFERTDILRRFEANIILYLRFIDDILLIWKDLPNAPNDFNLFKSCLKGQSKLKWKTEDLSTKTNFLDLMIMLDRKSGKCTARTYQKPMNLLLYIPASSAHPPGLLKSLVHGLLRSYWKQNSDEKDYIKFVRLLHQRLLATGQKAKNSNPIFIEAAEKIHKKSLLDGTKSPKKRLYENRLFFHYELHTCDVSRQLIRNSYENTCDTPDDAGHSFRNMPNVSGDKLRIDKFTVCYSRPNNIRDRIVPSKLHETSKYNVKNILEKNF